MSLVNAVVAAAATDAGGGPAARLQVQLQAFVLQGPGSQLALHDVEVVTTCAMLQQLQAVACAALAGAASPPAYASVRSSGSGA